MNQNSNNLNKILSNLERLKNLISKSELEINEREQFVEENNQKIKK